MPFVIATGALNTHTPGMAWKVGAFAVALALMATLSWCFDRAGLRTRLVVAGALTGMATLFICASNGPFQIDWHMYFFAVFAILAVYCDWRPIIFAAILTAAHHLILNFVFPMAVFPEGSDLSRVIGHAVVVVLVCGVLTWLSMRLAEVFERTREALEARDEALRESSSRLEMQQLVEERQTLLGEATSALAVARVATEQATQLRVEREELIVRSREEREEALAELSRALDGAIGDVVARLSHSSRAMLDVASETTAIAGSANGHVDGVAEVTRRSLESVETVATAAEQLSAASAEIGRAVSDAARVTESAADEARRTRKVVESLATAAGTIGEVVGLIDELMGQTNLLALNAAIEAARAGESGRSFSVVAGEMKKLAGRTEEATQRIDQVIGTIKIATDDAVEAIGSIATTVERVNELSNSIAASVEEQNAATHEIAVNVREVAAGTDGISAAVSMLASEHQRIGAVSTRVFSAATEITQHADALRREVDGFLTHIETTVAV